MKLRAFNTSSDRTLVAFVVDVALVVEVFFLLRLLLIDDFALRFAGRKTGATVQRTAYLSVCGKHFYTRYQLVR